MTDKIEELFGQIALRFNLISQARLDEALKLRNSQGERRPIGIILKDLGFLQERDVEHILAAQKGLVTTPAERPKAAKEDNLFGKIAIRLGLCTEEQIRECLLLQAQMSREHYLRLGDTLIIKGYLTPQRAKKVLDTQRGLLLYCPNCDTQYNVVMFNPGASLVCYRCGEPLRVPTRIQVPDDDESLYFGDEG